MKISKQQLKRHRAKAHNEAYEVENIRLSSLTPEERRMEIIREAVLSARDQYRPHYAALLGRK